jgi:hypothetical protein
MVYTIYMQYQVPQFIDVEDRIFGPFTFKQSIYLVGGAGLSYLIYRFTPSIWISALPMLFIMALAGALAFYKVNNRPFISVLESAFKYSTGSKLYLWKKNDKTTEKAKGKLGSDPRAAAKAANGKGQPGTAGGAEQYAGVMVPKVSQSRLKDLAWNLDIQERINAGEQVRK